MIVFKKITEVFIYNKKKLEVILYFIRVFNN